MGVSKKSSRSMYTVREKLTGRVPSSGLLGLFSTSNSSVLSAG